MFNFLKVSEGVKQIAKQMINNPNDWIQGEYEYINKSHPDIQIWTSNGAMSIKLRGNDGLSYAEKIYLNNAIKKSISEKLLEDRAL